MKKLFALALAPLFVLPACVADELGPEEIEVVEAAVDNNPFEPDPTCHVAGTDFTRPIVNGRRDVEGYEGWCCGESLCDDRNTCGDDYGKYTPSCAACNFFECIPGSSTEPGGGTGGGTRPPIYNPPGGGVLQP
jgi:hypothetical protein